ncbi:MAG: hypothetical protein GY822_29815 [Deltaproteobacteria bacterium]|nr:hypothetical protein [Deltaproteobacteria bacterium]
MSLQMAGRLSSLSSSAISLGRKAIYAQMDTSFDAALHLLNDQLALNVLTDDALAS